MCGSTAVPTDRTRPRTAAAPLPGRWQLRLTIRVDQLNDYITTLFYRVR